ncbi:MAG TPA: hypothetical protein VG962_05040 [Steroidobacteraceae bacterium]|nr:hypothetical protein [Steroidobacteraceae bacterium]
MPDSALCWKCGASLAQLSLPLLRLDVCKQCGAELHVCRQCVFYDVTVAKHCRETIAEEVRDKQRANFCDYFVLNNNAYQPAPASTASRAALDALFGGNSNGDHSSADEARKALEAMFKK